MIARLVAMSPKLDIRHPEAPPRKLSHFGRYLVDRSQRWWATLGVCSVFGLIALAQLASLFGDNPTVTVEAPSETRQLALYADTQHPLANLGEDYDRYAEADSAEKLTLIFQALENFDYWLKPRLNTAIGDALAKEALRMQTFAKKEANSGNYTTTDALNLFDMNGCLVKLPGQQCVLLRYAGEGIAAYAQGAEAGDVYSMSNGYLRMRAALLALGQFEISSTAKQDIPLQALANYRSAIYQALQYSPAAIAPVELQLPNTFGNTTPAEGLENAYPQDRSSEPLSDEPLGNELLRDESLGGEPIPNPSASPKEH